MPELPEIDHLSRQMRRILPGRRVSDVEVRQPKCLNRTPRAFRALLTGKVVDRVTSRGKWIFLHLDPGTTLLLSLGMGGDLLSHRPGAKLPDRYQLRLGFADGSNLTVRFWWFGYAHALPDAELAKHQMTARLGLNPLDPGDFSYARFRALLDGRRGSIKALLMDQRRIAGIGNVYIQDILFQAGLHPNRLIPRMSEADRFALHRSIVSQLRRAARRGGLAYEKDLHGRPGRFKEFIVGYRAGKPCPRCGTSIRKIRSGPTASFVCPRCQT